MAAEGARRSIFLDLRILMIRRTIFRVSFLAIILPFLTVLPVRAEGEEVRPLRLEGVTLNGVHSYLTESWVTMEMTVANPNSTGRDARVVVFYAIQPEVQYARDVWVPPRSTLSTWMLVGPAPKVASPPSTPKSRTPKSREMHALIYDRTGGQERLLLPRGEERIRTRLETYRPREPLTCILLDNLDYEDPNPLAEPPGKTEADEALDLVRAFRGSSSRSLSDHVLVIQDALLPPTPEGFDGVDHFVLAGKRIANDPGGQVSLRRWLEQGGKLWVMLDRTDPELVARILGGNLGFHVVDRTSLTTLHIEASRIASAPELPSEEQPTGEFEQPVDFIRVKVGPDYTVLNSVNGWPASFTKTVGLGKVIITTLGPRGWCRPRIATDPKSTYENFPDLPVVLPAMDLITQELLPPPEANPLPPKAWEPLVSADIGYSVVSVGTAGLMFGGFLLLLVSLGIGLRKWGRLEVLGWMGPLAALSTATAFLALGAASRKGVPPTLAIAQIVTVNPGTSDQAVTGLLGFYRPESGRTHINSVTGGLLDLDMGGLEGHTRRFVVTDVDQWHWENLDLPAGVRLGTFRSIASMKEPISAVAQFGPEGVVGKASLGRFQGVSDIVIQAPSRRCFAVGLQPDGAFTLNEGNLLPLDQFVTGTVLSDRQQKRQELYRRLLTGSKIGRRSDDSLLAASADPIEVPFKFETGVPPTGSALVTVPLEFEHTKPNTRVVVPRAFTSFRRIISLGATQANMEGQQAIDQHLRFQVPFSVFPLKLEKARLFAKVDMPMRQFTIRGYSNKGPIELRSEHNPADTIQVEITREDCLALDEQGGLHVDIAVSEADPGSGELPPKWIIQSLEIELIGRTLEEHP
jgi:hypothetical protein